MFVGHNTIMIDSSILKQNFLINDFCQLFRFVNYSDTKWGCLFFFKIVKIYDNIMNF